MNYRICKNKYGWYKIQQLKEYSFIIKWKRWVDASFILNELVIYSSREKAKSDIERFIYNDKETYEKDNKEWKCEQMEEDNV